MSDDEEEAQAAQQQRLTRQLTALQGSIGDLSNYAADCTEDNLPTTAQIEARHQLLDEIIKQATQTLLKLEGVTGTSQRRAPLMQTYTNIKAELIRLT